MIVDMAMVIDHPFPECIMSSSDADICTLRGVVL